jgi:hypothetical protein
VALAEPAVSAASLALCPHRLRLGDEQRELRPDHDLPGADGDLVEHLVEPQIRGQGGQRLELDVRLEVLLAHLRLERLDPVAH